MKSTTIKLKLVIQSDLRLDASYYSEEPLVAEKLLKESGHRIVKLGELCGKILYLPRFVRAWVNNESSGYPYLSASEACFFRPIRERYVSKKDIKNSENFLVKEGWILIECSGRIGVPIFVGHTLEKFFLDNHLIRIIPKDNVPSGYLYAYLSTRIGRALLKRGQYGAVVKEIDPRQLKPIPVPILENGFQKKIHEEIVKASKLRDKANNLLDNAEALLYQEIGLSKFSENDVSSGKIKAFSVKASEIDFRLDASYCNPINKILTGNLKQCKYPLTKLIDITKKIFLPLRFKRIYVEKNYGIPFLEPTHFLQIKPLELKYVSRKMTKNLDHLVLDKNQVLVARSGTVGRVGLVTSDIMGWVGSDDIIRIISDKNKTNVGYLLAYLSSPYGYYQLTKDIYGGVIDHIEEYHVEGVLLPKPPMDVQEKIGKLVIEAYAKKEEANRLEEAAINEVEKFIETPKTNGR